MPMKESISGRNPWDVSYGDREPIGPREGEAERQDSIVEPRQARRAEIGLGQENGLSLEQALIYQTYAAALEKKGFSERASDEAYAEADSLIAQLRDSGLAEADLTDLDFGDLAAIEG